MSWLIFAATGPLLNAVANHIDKLSISKYLKGGEVGALVIFSALFNLIALPIIYIVHSDIFALTTQQILLLATNDMLIVGAMLLYFWALETDEATYVVPLYQTIPLFGFALGYLLLGETITVAQSIGAGVIIMGAIILSLESRIGGLHFKSTVVWCMLGASLLYAINGVVFKFFALDVGFWPAVFWGCVGKVAVGVLILLCVPSYRKQFVTLIQKNKRGVLGLNAVSESLYIIGETAANYALTLATVGLVLLVGALQPFFVFIIGILLTLFIPRLGVESITRHALIQKCIGVSLLVAGTIGVSVY